MQVYTPDFMERREGKELLIVLLGMNIQKKTHIFGKAIIRKNVVLVLECDKKNTK